MEHISRTMVSATSWVIFFSLIVAFNITNAQVPYGALAGVGAALDSLGPVGALIALESGLPLGGIPFPGGMPFPGGFPTGYGSALGQGFPGGYGPGYPNNGFYSGFEGAGQPTQIQIPVPAQDNVQVTESVTVSETTSIPNGYNDGFPNAASQSFPTGFPAGGQYEAALAPEFAIPNGYNGAYSGQYPGQGYSSGNGGFTQVQQVSEPILIKEPFPAPVSVSPRPSNYPVEFIGSGGFPGPIQSGFAGPVPQGFFGPQPSFPDFAPTAYSGPMPGNFPVFSPPNFSGPSPFGSHGPIPSGFTLPGEYTSGFPGPASPSFPAPVSFPVPAPGGYPNAPASYPGPVSSGFPGPAPGGYPCPAPPSPPRPFTGGCPQGPITVIEECDSSSNSLSKILPLLLLLMAGNGCC